MSTADKVFCYGVVVMGITYGLYWFLGWLKEYMSPLARRGRATSRAIRRELEARLACSVLPSGTVGCGEPATDDSPVTPSDDGDPDLGTGPGPGYGGCCGM